MPNEVPEPPSAAGFWESLGDMRRAGPPAIQIALQDRGWTMLETFTEQNGTRGSRLSNAWLGAHGWRVQLFPQWLMWHEEEVACLAETAQKRGHTSLLGTTVDPDWLRVSAVWRVPCDTDHLSRFFEAHNTNRHLLFPEDLSFAIHAVDIDYVVFAGPEDFIRDALPPQAIGAEATAYVRQCCDEEHVPLQGWLDPVLAHYAPFLIDA